MIGDMYEMALNIPNWYLKDVFYGDNISFRYEFWQGGSHFLYTDVGEWERALEMGIHE